MNTVIKYLIISILLIIVLASGCGNIRSEFCRGETHYLYNQGNRAYRSGEFDIACECFRQVVELDPRYACAHAGLGNVALIMGDFADAERCYRQAIELEPGLEKILTPLLVACLEKKARQPLEKCGVDLRKVFVLLSEDNEKELDKALSKNVPLDLLAKDTLSLSLKELIKLQDVILEKARSGIGSSRCRLFYGYFLFYADQQEHRAIRVFEDVVEQIPMKERQEIYVMIGRLSEKTDRNNEAVSAYLKAVSAGLPMSGVAPYLSGIYGVPVEEITSASSRIEDSETEEERGPTIEATGLSVGTIRQTNEGTKRDIEEIVSHRTFRIPYTTSKPSSYHRISD